MAGGVYLRPAYQAPLTAHLVRPGQHPIPALSYITSSWWTYPGGGRMPDSAVSNLISHLLRQGLNPKVWVIQHHYGQGLTYQPESRFWPFQLIARAHEPELFRRPVDVERHQGGAGAAGLADPLFFGFFQQVLPAEGTDVSVVEVKTPVTLSSRSSRKQSSGR